MVRCTRAIWRQVSQVPLLRTRYRIAWSGLNTCRPSSKNAMAGKTCTGLAKRCFNVSIHIFGVRHHGPGCARSLRDALEKLQPDIVLVEGPPDAQGVMSLLDHEEMRPPVALLIYAPDNPKRAVYYPFTSFSPEWQALHYAMAHTIPARFMDLP